MNLTIKPIEQNYGDNYECTVSVIYGPADTGSTSVPVTPLPAGKNIFFPLQSSLHSRVYI